MLLSDTPDVVAAADAVLPTGDALKAALKEAMAEVLHEQRDLIRQIVEEALADLTMDDVPRDAIRPRLDAPTSRAGFVATEGRA